MPDPAGRPLRYAERRPPPALELHVRAFWTLCVSTTLEDGFVHHVWPDGCVSLVVVSCERRLVTAVVVGPGTRAQRVPLVPGAAYHGVRFWPDAGGRVLGVDPLALRDRSVVCGDVRRPELIAVAHAVAAACSPEEADRAFGAWLERAGAERPARDARLRAAVERLLAAEDELPIGALAREVGLSVRELQRRFRSAVGISPKALARIARGRAALVATMRGKDRWSEIAAALGYADQAHLANDLKSLMGLTPRVVERRLELIEHELLDD